MIKIPIQKFRGRNWKKQRNPMTFQQKPKETAEQLLIVMYCYHHEQWHYWCDTASTQDSSWWKPFSITGMEEIWEWGSNFLLSSVCAAQQNEILIQDWHYTTIILINPTVLLKVHLYPLFLLWKVNILRKMDRKQVRLLIQWEQENAYQSAWNDKDRCDVRKWV